MDQIQIIIADQAKYLVSAYLLSLWHYGAEK